jgi:hypothetical protein
VNARFAASAQDIAAIQQCFNAYRDAILYEQGAAAVLQLTQDTLDRYEFHRLAALHAPATFVRLLGAMDCISILRVRCSVPVADLQAMSGADLCVYAVDSGWVGKETVANNALGELVVYENWAEAAYINGGQQSTVRARFVRGSDGWKFDLMHTMYQSAPAFESAVASDELTKDETILTLLSQILNEDLGEELFGPLIEP